MRVGDNVEVNDQGKWRALWINFFVIVAMYIPYVGYSVKTLDIMDDLSLTYTAAGLIASVTALVGGIVLPYSGALADRFGPKKIIVSGLIIILVGQFIFSIAPSISILLFSRALIGIGVAILLIAPYTLAILWFQQSKSTGVGLGVMIASDGVGTLLATYIFSFIYTFYSWRIGSLIGCVVLLLMLVISIKLLKDPPDLKYHQEKVNFKSTNKAFLSLLGNRNVIGGSIYLICLFSTFSLAVYWVPTILIEESGWSEGLSGFIGSSFAVAGIASAITFGIFSDRLGSRKPFINIGSIGLVLSFIGFSYFYIAENYLLLAILLPIAGFFAYGGTPIVYALVADSVKQNEAGLANGIVLGVGMLLGNLVVPLLIGSVKDMSNTYSLGFIIMTIYLAIFCIINFFLIKEFKEEKSDTVQNDEYIINQK